MNGATRREDENQGELFADMATPWGFSQTTPAAQGVDTPTTSATPGRISPTPAPRAGRDRETWARFLDTDGVLLQREKIGPSKKYAGLARAQGEGAPPTAIDYERGGEVVVHLDLAPVDDRKLYGKNSRSAIGSIRGSVTITADGWRATAQNGVGRDYKRGRK